MHPFDAARQRGTTDSAAASHSRGVPEGRHPAGTNGPSRARSDSRRGPGPVLVSGPHPERLTGDSTVIDRRAAAPGDLRLRPAPDGLPDARLAPPVVAEAGDPFTAVRVIDLVARVERGRPVGVDDLVAALNARHLDWLFDRAAVVDVLIALQANWMADYRNASGIVLEDGPYGPTLTLEDSPRVDPWIVRQALREGASCRERLVEFARRDGTNHVG